MFETQLYMIRIHKYLLLFYFFYQMVLYFYVIYIVIYHVSCCTIVIMFINCVVYGRTSCKTALDWWVILVKYVLMNIYIYIYIALLGSAGMKNIIRDAIAHRQKHPAPPGVRLLLDVLLENDFSDDVIFADALTFSMAGFHTTGYGACCISVIAIITLLWWIPR